MASFMKCCYRRSMAIIAAISILLCLVSRVPAEELTGIKLEITMPKADHEVYLQKNPKLQQWCDFYLRIEFNFEALGEGNEVVEVKGAFSGDALEDVGGTLPAKKSSGSFDKDKTVMCGATVLIVAKLQIKDKKGNQFTKFIVFELSCIPEQPKPVVKPKTFQPPRCVPPSGQDRLDTLGFGILNPDSLAHTYELAVQNSIGWVVAPSAFAPLTLNAGEDTTIYFASVVPGGIPDGTRNTFSLTATDVVDESLADTDSSTVVICASQIPTLSEWGMIIMFVVMAGGLVWFVVRQRRRAVAA